ncbi:MAG: sodium:solute symporter [Cyanobacteria bacterium]|nr:sodium:solute symporter [Cyanobacteriota bacterium]
MIDFIGSALPLYGLALGLLLALLAVGTLLGKLLGMHRWGIPEALLAGSLGLLIAPTGALPLIPPAVISLWDQLPLILLTLVFASLLLGKPLPALGGLWRPLSAQVLMALTLAFGQYVVAGLAVLLVLQPLLGAPDVMACLIEVAFEGGHGSAAAMGPTYARLGLQSGEALGLAMATVGLLASTLVGGLVVVVARRQRWLLSDGPAGTEASGLAGGASQLLPAQPLPAQALPLQPLPLKQLSSESLPSQPRPTEPCNSEPKPVEPQASASAPAVPAPIALGAVNLALNGVAVAIGWGMLEGLRLVAENQGGGFALVIEALPVFPLALVGSLLVRLVLERSGQTHWASAPVQNRIGTISADLLITAATACLDLSLLAKDWLPLTVLAVVGLLWNLAVFLLLAPRILPANWLERGLIEFGQATGVAASGLLLLNMVDPEDRNGTLTPFSIKQLILQPLLAGGVITVVAPLAVDSWGLPTWTAFCFALVVLWISLALWLAGRQAAA